MVPTVCYKASHWTGACLPKTVGSPFCASFCSPLPAPCSSQLWPCCRPVTLRVAPGWAAHPTAGAGPDGGRVWPSLPALLASRQVKDPEARIPAPSWEVQPRICLGVTVCRSRGDARLAGGVEGSDSTRPHPERAARRALGVGWDGAHSVPPPTMQCLAHRPTGRRMGHWARADMEDSTAAAMQLPSPATSFLSGILPTHTTLATPRPQVILGGYTDA